MDSKSHIRAGKIGRLFLAGLLALALSTPAFGQWRRLTLGVEAGVPLNGAFVGERTATRSGKNGEKILAGFTAETPLPWKLELRGDVFFRPMSFHRTTTQTGHTALLPILPLPGPPILGVTTSRQWWNSRGHSWEFPVTVQKSLVTHGPLKSFASGGFTLRRTNSIADSTFEFVGTSPALVFSGPTTTIKDWQTGFVLGAGFEIQKLPRHLSPQIRWTSWIEDGPSKVVGAYGPARNSVDFVLGFRFR